MGMLPAWRRRFPAVPHTSEDTPAPDTPGQNGCQEGATGRGAAAGEAAQSPEVSHEGLDVSDGRGDRVLPPDPGGYASRTGRGQTAQAGHHGGDRGPRVVRERGAAGAP